MTKKNCNVGSYGNLNSKINIIGKPHGNKPCGKQDVNKRIILQQNFKTTKCVQEAHFWKRSSVETLQWQWHALLQNYRTVCEHLYKHKLYMECHIIRQCMYV